MALAHSMEQRPLAVAIASVATLPASRRARTIFKLTPSGPRYRESVPTGSAVVMMESPQTKRSSPAVTARSMGQLRRAVIQTMGLFSN